jgi:hypothetical protein
LNITLEPTPFQNNGFEHLRPSRIGLFVSLITPNDSKDRFPNHILWTDRINAHIIMYLCVALPRWTYVNLALDMVNKAKPSE